MNAEVMPLEQRLPAAEVTPLTVLMRAIQDNSCDLARLEKLMDLEARWRADRAKQSYVRAFAQFKKNMPDVVKDMLNKQYGSDYSSLANLVNTTNKVLGEFGLNARWDIDQKDGMKAVCIMTHEDGHEERVVITGPLDTSGAKNPLQQIKSTLTYLEGATFQAITGVVARSASADDDGNGSGPRPAAVTAPDGYDNWRADMTAKAEDGSEKLQAAWKESSNDFRRYVVKHDELWWAETKRKAAKVQAS
jgi:hypothetical protein